MRFRIIFAAVLGCLLLCGCPNAVPSPVPAPAPTPTPEPDKPPTPVKPPKNGKVLVEWAASADTAVKGYYVYRDGVKVTPLEAKGCPIKKACQYTDPKVPAGTHTYYVTSWDGKKESAPSTTSTPPVIVVP